MTVYVEAARHMSIGRWLSATTAEGASNHIVPRIGLLDVFQVAAEVVCETMALPDILFARLKPRPVIWNSLCFGDDGGTFSGIDVFARSIGVLLEPLSKMDKKHSRFIRKAVGRDLAKPLEVLLLQQIHDRALNDKDM